jgi:hypothetical protein
MRIPNQSTGVIRTTAGTHEALAVIGKDIRPSQFAAARARRPLSLTAGGTVLGAILNCPDDLCCDGDGLCRCCTIAFTTG